MMKQFLLALALSASTLAAGADKPPYLHQLFADHMVLQRDLPVPVWGWTEPGKAVTVSMNGKSARAIANAQGKWQVRIGPFKAGGPYTLRVSGPQRTSVKDVLVGDVWLCSGQSNMEMGMGAIDMPQEIATANYPRLRLFTVPRLASFEEQSQVDGQWHPTTPASVAERKAAWEGFSATCYFFGRELHRDLNIPIGLIHSSWGGTPAEAWTSAEALATMADFKPAVAELQQAIASSKAGTYNYDQRMKDWWIANDPGSSAGPGWADPTIDASAWKTMRLPTLWEKAGLPDFDGIVWFRREFELPNGWAGKDLKLALGPIDDRDATWVNGVLVGETNQWDKPREYSMPGTLLRAGKNVIAVRVLDTGSGGGIYGKPELMTLGPDGQAALSLAGDWKYRVSTELGKASPLPQPLDDKNNLTVLYNGMIANLVPFAIKGAVWYQGESNSGRPDQYRVLLPTLIADWRKRFGVGDFPFHIVQLASYLAPTDLPSQSGWAELREAQLLTALNTPNAGLAVAIDIGDANDVHPKDKLNVGKRLALNALAKNYGRRIEYQGPLFKSIEIRGNSLRLSFDHIGGGLVAKGGDKLNGFAIAGADGKFVWADAVIEGEQVVLSAPGLASPAAARYDWANNPGGNFYNKAGLPASPFRTDGPRK